MDNDMPGGKGAALWMDLDLHLAAKKEAKDGKRPPAKTRPSA